MQESEAKQDEPSDRELRLFSCACVKLALEMVDSLDEETRAETLMVLEFAVRMANEGIRPPPESELAELAELAEMLDAFSVYRLGYLAPLHPKAKEAADWSMNLVPCAYAEQEYKRAKEAADPELVNEIEDRVKRAGNLRYPLSWLRRLAVRLAGLIHRGDRLKDWFETPGWPACTTRASFERMAAAEADAPWFIAKVEAKKAAELRVRELRRSFFGR